MENCNYYKALHSHEKRRLLQLRAEMYSRRVEMRKIKNRGASRLYKRDRLGRPIPRSAEDEYHDLLRQECGSSIDFENHEY